LCRVEQRRPGRGGRGPKWGCSSACRKGCWEGDVASREMECDCPERCCRGRSREGGGSPPPLGSSWPHRTSVRSEKKKDELRQETSRFPVLANESITKLTESEGRPRAGPVARTDAKVSRSVFEQFGRPTGARSLGSPTGAPTTTLQVHQQLPLPVSTASPTRSYRLALALSRQPSFASNHPLQNGFFACVHLGGVVGPVHKG